MEGMLWAALLMIGIPLLVGIGVAVAIYRHRRQLHAESEKHATERHHA